MVLLLCCEAVDVAMPHAVEVSSRVKIWFCFAVVAGKSTTMCVRHEEDSAMMEELWFLSRLAAGCASFGVEQR